VDTSGRNISVRVNALQSLNQSLFECVAHHAFQLDTVGSLCQLGERQLSADGRGPPRRLARRPATKFIPARASMGMRAPGAMVESGEVQGETLEIGERTMIEGTFVSSPQDHVGRATRLQCFDPAGRAQAPAVAGPEAGKAELGQGRRKIIAARIGKLEKLGCNDDTHRVASDIFSIGVTATVTKEPRLGLHRADVEPVAQDIPRRARAISTVPAFVPQHCRLLDRRYAPRIPPWEGRLCFRRYRISEGHENPFVTRSVP
jgi:hypothetical protein